jgi:hypothetical protein
LKSQAHLIAANLAPWTPQLAKLRDDLAKRLAG